MSSQLTEYDSPETFTFKQRLIMALAPPIVGFILRAISYTCRYSEHDRDRIQQVQEKHGSVLLGLWHEGLVVVTLAWRDTGYHGLTSYSFDGELAARLLQTMGLKALRGSSSKGGFAALGHLAKATQKVGMVGLTLDGPKGPRREAKPGLAIVSVKTGVPIIPVAFAAPGAWRMKSWDKLIIPKPFCEIRSAYGNPIDPNEFKGPKQIERIRVAIEEEMARIHKTIEV